MRKCEPQESLITAFEEIFASINKISILAGRLGTGLLFYFFFKFHDTS